MRGGPRRRPGTRGRPDTLGRSTRPREARSSSRIVRFFLGLGTFRRSYHSEGRCGTVAGVVRIVFGVLFLLAGIFFFLTLIGIFLGILFVIIGFVLLASGVSARGDADRISQQQA